MKDSGHRDSNPVIQLGRLVHNPYAMPALKEHGDPEFVQRLIYPVQLVLSSASPSMHTGHPLSMFKVVGPPRIERGIGL